MPPKDQIESTQNSSMRLTPTGRRTQGWSFSRLLWTAGTLLQKLGIQLQDCLGLYSYQRWIQTVESDAFRRAIQPVDAQDSASLDVCFVIDMGSASEAELSNTLESIEQQSNCTWHVAVLTDGRDLAGWARTHADVQILAGVQSWQSAAKQLPGEWLVPLAPGDRLASDWSALVRLNQQPDADLIYWDEDELSPGDRRQLPQFKPSWSPELLFAVNYLETGAFRKRLLYELDQGGGEADADWIFQAAHQARRVLHLPFILTHRAPGTSAGFASRLKQHALGVQAYLSRCGYTGAQAWVTGDQKLRITWEAEYPLVSVIIPTKNNLSYLQRCLTSLLEKTDYPHYEVILMDDHSSDSGVLAYYDELLKTQVKVSIFNNAEIFNYSRFNNQGAAKAKGSLLLFLNNDVEILESGWLKEMVRWAQMPGVGMVGARLLYPDGNIQHAGIVLGMTGHAGHVYAGKATPAPGIFASPEVYRNVTAVTGACMLVRRDVFLNLGGFDEQLGLVFNDVDLGVRFVINGWRVVYTPCAVLTHYEGRSRARFIPPGDIRLGAQRLRGEITLGDRYYNPNLSLAVNWPTLVRKGEVGAVDRLEHIVKLKS